MNRRGALGRARARFSDHVTAKIHNVYEINVSSYAITVQRFGTDAKTKSSLRARWFSFLEFKNLA